jgi:hypothetical protein
VITASGWPEKLVPISVIMVCNRHILSKENILPNRDPVRSQFSRIHSISDGIYEPLSSIPNFTIDRFSIPVHGDMESDLCSLCFGRELWGFQS